MTMTYRSHPALILSLGMIVLGGCVLDSEPAGELPSASTGPEATTTQGTQTSTTGPQTASITASSADPSAGDSSTGPGASDSSGSTGPIFDGECPEPVQGVACQAPGNTNSAFAVLIDGRPVGEGIEQTCTLVNQLDDGSTLTLVLQCGNEGTEVELALTTENPHIGRVLAGNGPFELSYSEEPFDEANTSRYLVLRYVDGGTPLVVAVDTPEFEPPASFDPTPLSLSVEPSDCEPDWVGKFDVEIQRAALVAAFDDQIENLFEGNMAYVGSQGSYAVFAQDVDRFHCFGPMGGYNYALWFVRTLAIFFPDG